jgi:hypothetical protein
MSTAHWISNELRKIRRWKLTSWWLLAGLFLVGGLAMAILPEPAGKFVIFGYFALMMANAFRVGFAECPVCRKAFHVRTTRLGIPLRYTLTSSCLNCGIRLTASDSEIEQAIKNQQQKKAAEVISKRSSAKRDATLPPPLP